MKMKYLVVMLLSSSLVKSKSRYGSGDEWASRKAVLYSYLPSFLAIYCGRCHHTSKYRIPPLPRMCFTDTKYSIVRSLSGHTMFTICTIYFIFIRTRHLGFCGHCLLTAHSMDRCSLPVNKYNTVGSQSVYTMFIVFYTV